MAAGHEPAGHPACCVTIAEGRWSDVVKPDSPASVCHHIAPDVNRGAQLCVRPGVLPFGSDQRRCAGAPHVSGIDPYGIYKHLTTLGWSGWTRFGLCTPGLGVPGLCHMSSAAVRLVVGSCRWMNLNSVVHISYCHPVGL